MKIKITLIIPTLILLFLFGCVPIIPNIATLDIQPALIETPKNKAELINILKRVLDKQGPATDLSFINTSKIIDMSGLFSKFKNFNGNISNWNTANVMDMSYMFDGAEVFNQDIGDWNTFKVTNMNQMFRNATAFSGNISGWDVSNVTDMDAMFEGSGLSRNKPALVYF